MSYVKVADYPWIDELEKTLVQSLATSFGLDFLLFKDKLGGDVDTIHNVRHGIYATEYEKAAYDQRGDYNSAEYHQHENYKKTGKVHKEMQKNGYLQDAYQNKNININEKRDLDHIKPCVEIHNDAGRVLAGLDGANLANHSSNLQSTNASVNRSKKDTPISEYLNKLPSLIDGHEQKLEKMQQRCAKMPRNTPEERHKARKLEDEIQAQTNKINNLKGIDPEKMRRKGEKSDAVYNESINKAYYFGSKFYNQALPAAGKAGLCMGARQVLGLVLAEVWFELRGQFPKLIEKIKHGFSMEVFFASLKDTLQGIWHRVRTQFYDFLHTFKDGVFAGVLASISTTLLNIFLTSQKATVKLIREMWSFLVKAIKLIAFNPEQLSFVDLCKAVVSVLSVGAATVVGTMTYAYLAPIFSFPLGGELASFISAFLTGILTLGANYFLIHSEMANKVWVFLESKPLQDLRSVNADLDNYLEEIGRIEYNIDVEDLECFSYDLSACNDEAQKTVVLSREVAKRKIELPFEMGNASSTRGFLASLVKK